MRFNCRAGEMNGFVAVLAVAVAAGMAGGHNRVAGADLADLAARPLGDGEAFAPVSTARLETAAARLREVLGPLDALLARSPSGADWRRYL